MSNFYVSGAAAMTSDRDDWETPQALFDRLQEDIGFTLDPCSTHENAKCERHYTAEENGLAQSWRGETVFCNPPYGRSMRDWTRKCRTEAEGGGVHRPSRTGTHRHGVVLGGRRPVRARSVPAREVEV